MPELSGKGPGSIGLSKDLARSDWSKYAVPCPIDIERCPAACFAKPDCTYEAVKFGGPISFKSSDPVLMYA